MELDADLIVITHRHEVYIPSSLRETCTVTSVSFSPLVKSTLPMSGLAGAHHLGDGFAIRLPQLRLAASSGVVGRDFGLGLRHGGASSWTRVRVATIECGPQWGPCDLNARPSARASFAG